MGGRFGIASQDFLSSMEWKWDSENRDKAIGGVRGGVGWEERAEVVSKGVGTGSGE